MPGRSLSAAVAAKRVHGRLLAWRAAPGTTLETSSHPLFHHQIFGRCRRSLVHLNRIVAPVVEGYKMLEGSCIRHFRENTLPRGLLPMTKM